MTPPTVHEPLILASQSPRRQELLKLCGIPFSVCVSQVEEQFNHTLPLEKATENLAWQKAKAVQDMYPEKIIIGADTIVCLDGIVFGKPKNQDDAFSMLSSLSGRTHQVVTGVSILTPQKEILFSQKSKVTFFSLTPEEIQNYIATGEPMDKAGSYGIQGKGTLFVNEIEGDFHSIMGLPVSLLYRELKKLLTHG